MRGVWAVVVAAGRATRLDLGYNKAFYALSGRSVLSRCIDGLHASDCFEGAVVVLGEKDMPAYAQLIETEGQCPLVRAVVVGGESRQESVLNGLNALPAGAEVVAVHDAARCFCPPDLIRRTVESAKLCGSGVAACRVIDTIKRVDDHGRAVETLPRASLRAVQTPQSFRLDILKRAHSLALEKGDQQVTDDAGLVERAFGPVHLVESAPGANPKLTTPEDARAFQALLSSGLRVGQGYDVHRLAPGRPLVLCGVEIPHDKGLMGHSDADVAAHALMDALLGAAALGDIGQHFPDGDPAYKGASSIALTRRVAEILRKNGWNPANVDVTIAAQAPRLAPYRDAMRLSVAKALQLPVDRVSVKATTTEGLGFEGRGEGISAVAAATITQ
jgi:2-C-methyl-D-erythritol 4-phosphate cytidylyltransferase/2-C-methyl-D-erythritol 2,4-cyclodiphosphate synthase